MAFRECYVQLTRMRKERKKRIEYYVAFAAGRVRGRIIYLKKGTTTYDYGLLNVPANVFSIRKRSRQYYLPGQIELLRPIWGLNLVRRAARSY